MLQIQKAAIQSYAHDLISFQPLSTRTPDLDDCFFPGQIFIHFLFIFSPRTPDDGLDGFLDCIPVTRVDACQVATKVVANFLELFPALLIVEQADGDADASETPRTADSV